MSTLEEKNPSPFIRLCRPEDGGTPLGPNCRLNNGEIKRLNKIFHLVIPFDATAPDQQREKYTILASTALIRMSLPHDALRASLLTLGVSPPKQGNYETALRTFEFHVIAPENVISRAHQSISLTINDENLSLKQFLFNKSVPRNKTPQSGWLDCRTGFFFSTDLEMCNRLATYYRISALTVASATSPARPRFYQSAPFQAHPTATILPFPAPPK